MRHHKENPQCHGIDIVDKFVQEVMEAETPSLPMGRVIINLDEQVEYEFYMEVSECLLQLQETWVDKATRKIEELGGIKQ